MKLQGHLSREALDAALPSVSGPCALLVDARAMTGYDLAARTRFVEWNTEHRERIRRVAIVTDKIVWRTVISAMSLASRQPMKAFADAEEAKSWAMLD